MCRISTVSNQGFKKLVNTLDKRYTTPSRHHFTRVALPALYNKCHEEVANDVSTAEYFATTMDLWSSHTMEPYISLTIHYIDADFNLKTKQDSWPYLFWSNLLLSIIVLLLFIIVLLFIYFLYYILFILIYLHVFFLFFFQLYYIERKSTVKKFFKCSCSINACFQKSMSNRVK